MGERFRRRDRKREWRRDGKGDGKMGRRNSLGEKDGKEDRRRDERRAPAGCRVGDGLSGTCLPIRGGKKKGWTHYHTKGTNDMFIPPRDLRPASPCRHSAPPICIPDTFDLNYKD